MELEPDSVPDFPNVNFILFKFQNMCGTSGT